MKSFLKILYLLLFTVSIQSCSLLSAAGLSKQGQPVKKVPEDLGKVAISKSETKIDHSIWDALLKEHVNNYGLVDYKGFKNDRSQLDTYLKTLSTSPPSKDWAVQELLAYYINLYNAYTVHAILENYPTKSIKDIDGVWTKGNVPIGDKNLSLGGIENGILRKMNEPRIHFAINCASISCPNLLNEAFLPHKIDEQLEKVATEFINGDKNELSANNPKLSSIFDWYKKDFEVNNNVDVIGYINQYAKTKINQNTKIQYKTYNWNLNGQK